jgi:cytochrome c
MKLILIIAALACGGCLIVSDDIGPAVSQMTGGGNMQRGKALIHEYGCGSCHDIQGVDGAHGLVGPSLDRIGNRTFIAGVLLNTPDNLIRWLKDPPAVDSMTAMPNMQLTDRDTKDIAAYLYTLR